MFAWTEGPEYQSVVGNDPAAIKAIIWNSLFTVYIRAANWANWKINLQTARTMELELYDISSFTSLSQTHF